MEQGSIYSALSGALSLQRRMDTVSNNLANANTTGYKADQTLFQGVLADAQRGEGAGESSQDLVYPVLEGQNTDFDQGSLRQTGRSLDMALEGDGFFQVRTGEDGSAYTRHGKFQVTAEGRLTDSQGRAVLNTDGEPIDLPSRDVSVNGAGEVFVPGQQAPVTQLAVQQPGEGTRMIKQGDNLLQPAGAGGDQAMVAAEDADVRSGYLEQSNVNTMREMVRMIDVQRSYQSITKSMSTIDQTFSDASRQLAQLQG